MNLKSVQSNGSSTMGLMGLTPLVSTGVLKTSSGSRWPWRVTVSPAMVPLTETGGRRK
jgi:hypothetical protein